MERTYLQLFRVFCIMVSVSGFIFGNNNVKIEAPQFAVVGEYANIICISSKAKDLKMKINQKVVNATKVNATTISFRLHSDKEQVFRVECALLSMREIKFGYKPDFNYSLERNIDRNILLFITFAIEDSYQYHRVECQHSKNKKVWSNCSEEIYNKTSYMYLTENWLYFKINITSTNNYGNVTKIETKLKENIPIRFPQLSNISFTSLPSVDPFQQYGEIKLTYSNIGMNAYKLLYELKYWSEFDDPQYGKQTLLNRSNTFILEKLLPYTMYDVAARVKEENNGLWNPPLTTKFMTATAPANPPRTTNGSYYLWNCTETGLGKCIIVYWEKIPLKLVNGKLKGYCVQIIDENNLSDHCQDTEHLIRNSLFKEFKDLPSNKALTFAITTVNNDKRKPQATIMQVGEKVPKGPKAVYVIQKEENLYNVSWLLYPDQLNNNVTIFFCRKNDVSTPHMYCMDNVKWELATNESYLLVNNSMKPLDFAAYISTKEGMSPLTKAECVFKPGKPKKPKQPEILPSRNKITVLWPEFTCESLNGIPVDYEILYNKGPKCDNGSKKQFKPMGIKPPESSSDIQSLNPETKYSVCIRVVTGKYTSLMSDPLTIETLSDENNTPAIVGGIFGTLIGIVLIAVFIYCIMNGVSKMNVGSYGTCNSTYNHEYATIESKDTKEHQNKANGISNLKSYMKVGLDSNSTGILENDCDTSANTTTSLVSSESIPSYSADKEHNNLEEHHEVQDKSVRDVNSENPGNFNEIPENSEMKNPENSEMKNPENLSENVGIKYMFAVEQEAGNNLTKDHAGVTPENIELNMVGCPGYVIVGDHCQSPETTPSNSNEMFLPGKDSNSLGYSTSNDMPTTNTSDPIFSMLPQTPNESFEEESKDSKSYNNPGYVTAEYTKAVEDSENTVIPEYVSDDNSFPVQQTPADIPQEQNIPTKILNSIEDSKTNCSLDYVLVENLNPSHQILTI
ncbi:receptor-type tyrosine-protein phosphatase F-like [Octopus vulgaris]|nr:receptor-type tyrosine-protein phosphatase F-like [Octopus vulgaris]